MCSATIHLDGKMTKSQTAVPATAVWAVRTQKIEGSFGQLGLKDLSTYRMIERDGVDRAESVQIVFVRTIISVPSDNIERGVITSAFEQGALELVDDSEFAASVFVSGNYLNK